MKGFVYLWYDRKHRRFYLGKHWGEPDDGYVCSSPWMKRAYNRRPKDFKRRILEWCDSPQSLAESEVRWGAMIEKEELSGRYYNIRRPSINWQSDQAKVDRAARKMRGRTFSPESREKMSVSRRGKKQSRKTIEKRRESLQGQKRSEEVRAKFSELAKKREERKRLEGFRVSDETRKKLSVMMSGRTLSEEHKRKLSESAKKRETKKRNERLAVEPV